MPPGKPGKCVGFVVADMLNWRTGIDWLQPSKRHRMPAVIFLTPITGRLPSFGLDHGPAVGKPKRRSRVAAGRNKFDPLRIGHQMSGDLHMRNQHIVRRSLVVEAKTIGVVADCMNALRHLNVTARTLRSTRTLPARMVDGFGGVL